MSMREYGKPVRPPRSSKITKDTTGYLMKIIQTLSISQDNAERDKQKEMLEKEFSDSDRALVRLVKAHQDELITAMQTFSKNSANLKSSIIKCSDIREKLTRCKTLLHCRTDELKRLWLECVEHERVMSLFEEIEDIMSVQQRIQVFLQTNMYLDATKLLVSSILLLEGNLNGIDALKELKADLYCKREELHQTLIRELIRVLFVSVSEQFLKRFKRHGSGRLRHGAVTVLQHSESLCNDKENPAEDDATMQATISNLMECITLLNRLPETIEVLKEKCQEELLAIVRHTAQHVANASQNVPFTYQQSYLGCGQSKDQQDLLFDLLDLTLRQFKCIIKSHGFLLASLEYSKVAFEKNGGSGKWVSYEMADIWSKVEAVLELLVAEYVGDIENSSHSSPPSGFSNVPHMIDMSSFFLKKKNPKAKSTILFQFDSSSHAINMKTYLTEQKDILKEKINSSSPDSEANVFICPAASKNIMVIFKPLSEFLSEMTKEMNTECSPLYAFINRCVKVFMGQVTMEVNYINENAAKSLENWKIISEADEMKKANVTSHVLHSAVYINDRMTELSEIFFALPSFSSHILVIICTMLQNYRETCQSAYAGLVQPYSDDKRIVSATWAKDKDISRLLRSLPNWPNLKEHTEESPEEIRFRNKKESEILTANLSGDQLISQHELLLDTSNLHNLAVIRESIGWLSSNILMLAENIPKQTSVGDHTEVIQPEMDGASCEEETDAVPNGTVESLMKLACDFQNLSDMCLLLLHLEVRVHCFYHLQPLAQQSCYATRLDSQEPDPEVTRLNIDLSKIHEALEFVLKPCNIKYIFEGLGELIASILINNTSKIRRINENGVKKINRNIFALQQNLTAITMFREVALDRAREYFDLLNHTPEEILNLIVENGPQFQELEYSSAFHLLQKIQPGMDSNMLNSYLERLHQILNEVAVSV